MKKKEIMGTAFGLEPSKFIWVKEYFKAQNTSGIVLHKEDVDVLSLLKEDLKIE